MLLRHLLRSMNGKLTLNFVKVSAHSGIEGNEYADKLAKQGGDYKARTKWWKRPYRRGHFDNEGYIRSLQGGEEIQVQTACRNLPTTSARDQIIDPDTIGEDRQNRQGHYVNTLKDWTKTLEVVARRCGNPLVKSDKFSQKVEDMKEELQIACKQRNLEENPVARQLQSLEICKLKRNLDRLKQSERCEIACEKRCLPWSTKTKVRQLVYALKNPETNQVCVSVGDMRDHVGSVYTALFNDLGDVIPDWIHRRWCYRDLDRFQHIDGNYIRELIFQFQKNKTCAEDNIVVEMLFQIDTDVLDELACIFQLRLLNHISEDGDDSWDLQYLNLIRKKLNALFVKDFRPIAIIPVLQKLYSRLILNLTGGKCAKLLAPQFAFRTSHQAHEPIFIMRQLVEKALEWNQSLLMCDGDVHKAYDCTRHSTMITGLQKKGVEDILIAAIIREIRRAKTKVVLDKYVVTDPISRTRSAPQGDPGMPQYFNVALDEPAGKFVQLCQSREWGWKLGNGMFLGLILYADNFWLIATSPSMMECMLTKWLNLLEADGWYVPLDETKWGTTLQDNVPLKVHVRGETVKRVERATGFQAPGCQLSFNGRNILELKSRMAKAWATFTKHADLLCCKSSPFRKRIVLLDMLINNGLFWCSGSWNLPKKNLYGLRALQGRILRRMLGFKRDHRDDAGAYMQKANHGVKAMKHRHDIADWDLVAYRNLFGWAGHVSRIREYDENRVTLRVLMYRDREWLTNVEAQNSGRQLHGRYLRTWRWEYPLAKYAASKDRFSWHLLAQDKRSWLASLDEMAKWYDAHR